MSIAATIDDLLPAPHFRERHERHVDAPPAAVWGALHELRLDDSPLARLLMDVRALPARLLGHRRPAMVTARFVEAAPIPVLASVPCRALVAGGVLQPWKPAGGAPPPALDAPALRAFDDPGWVKCAMDFVLEPDGAGTRLTTETRVRATDRRTRLVFGAYWLVIRAGSGLIRREMLRVVARRAEAG